MRQRLPGMPKWGGGTRNMEQAMMKAAFAEFFGGGRRGGGRGGERPPPKAASNFRLDRKMIAELQKEGGAFRVKKQLQEEFRYPWADAKWIVSRHLKDAKKAMAEGQGVKEGGKDEKFQGKPAVGRCATCGLDHMSEKCTKCRAPGCRGEVRPLTDSKGENQPRPGGVASGLAAAAAAAAKTEATKVSRKAGDLEDTDDDWRGVRPALGVVLKSLAEESLPSELPAVTPQQRLAKIQCDSRTSTSADCRANLEREIGKLKSAAAAIEDLADCEDAFKGLQAKIIVAERNLQKATRNAPSTEMVVKDLEVILKTVEGEALEKQGHRERGATNFAGRCRKRREQFGKLREELDAAEALVTQREAEITAKHAMKAAATAKADKELQDLVKGKIQDLKTGASQAEAAPMEVMPATPPTPTPESVEWYEAELERMKKELARNRREREAEEERGAKEVHEVAIFSKAMQRFEFIAEEAKIANLPLYKTTKEQSAACSQVFQLFELWQQGGSSVPFSLAELHESTKQTVKEATKEDMKELTQRLLGPLWGLWFNDDLDYDESVPRQAALFMYKALQKIAEGFAAGEIIEAAAATSYAVLVGKQKKRKTNSPYSA